MSAHATKKPRIVYIHGDGVLHWDWGWVARLHADLSSAGFPTSFQLMPDSIEARAEYWMPFLKDHVQVSEDDVVLGWSCGAVAAMRVAQRQPTRGLVLVAPYFTDLGLDVVRKAGWVTNPWDWEAIKSNTARIAMFHSDDDPYITQEEFKTLSQFLAIDPRVLGGAGHFGDQDTFPELLDHIVQTYG